MCDSRRDRSSRSDYCSLFKIFSGVRSLSLRLRTSEPRYLQIALLLLISTVLLLSMLNRYGSISIVSINANWHGSTSVIIINTTTNWYCQIDCWWQYVLLPTPIDMNRLLIATPTDILQYCQYQCDVDRLLLMICRAPVMVQRYDVRSKRRSTGARGPDRV